MDNNNNNNKALNGFTTDIFACICVKDYKASLNWYERLFGCPLSFLPNDIEAVWQLANHQWMYILVNDDNSSHTIQNIIVKNLDILIDEIAKRGIDYSKEELPADNTRKVIYKDPDGNEIGFISLSS